MKNKTKIIWFTVLIIAVLGISFIAYNRLAKDYQDPTATNAEETTKTEYEQAPDATIYNSDGNAVSLASLFNGKPVVVNFWASWCSPCKNEMPEFQSAYKEMGNDVNFVMINLTDGSRETQDSAKEFISNNNYTFPVYFDKDMDASNKYAIYSIPTTLFINSNGEIINIYNGTLTKELLEQNINLIS